MLQIIAAVIVANGFFAAFAFAMYVAWRLQTKEGKADTELPFWVYPCLIAAPALAAIGFYLSPVQ